MKCTAFLSIPGEHILDFIRVEGLPKDVTVLNIGFDFMTYSVEILLESSEFRPVAPGAQSIRLSVEQEVTQTRTLRCLPIK